MIPPRLHICRREFLGTSVGTLGALATASTAFAFKPNQFRKIYVPADAALPVKTAASELADKTGALLVAQRHQGAIRDGEIVLVAGGDVATQNFSEAMSKT